MSFPIQRDISRQQEIAFKAIKQQLAALRKGQAPGQGGTLAQLQAQLENLLLQIAGLSKGSGGGGSTVQAQSPIVENFVQAAGTSAAFPYAAYESGSGVVSAADSGSVQTVSAVIGIATAPAAGGKVAVTTFGDVDSTAWSWTPLLPVFVGSNGAMTQAVPTPGYPVAIGYAVSPTRIRVAIGGPASEGPGTFVFQQQTPQSSWSIAHGLNKFPSVTLLDSAGEEIEGDVSYPDQNTVLVALAYAVSGMALLN